MNLKLGICLELECANIHEHFANVKTHIRCCLTFSSSFLVKSTNLTKDCDPNLLIGH